MAISDEERGNAAAELRVAACGEFAHVDVLDVIAGAIGVDVSGMYTHEAESKVYAALADLIDRGTCHNVYNENEMGACDNGFECDVCGNRIEDYEHYSVTGKYNYCSKCGRAVVE